MSTYLRFRVRKKVTNGDPRRLERDHIANLFLGMLIMQFG